MRSVILLMLTGFVVRLVVAQVIVGGLNKQYEGDEGGYVSLATHVTQGLGFTDNSGSATSYRTPGLPVLLAIPISLAGPHVVNIRIFMCLVETLLIPVFYLLVQSVAGSASLALVAGAMAIFFPSWVIPSGAVMTDVPTAILIALMTWMLIEGHGRNSLLWIIGAGVFWGAATLTRAGCLIYGPGIILWLFLMMPSWKKRLAATAALTIPFVCILAPWSVRNTYVHGKFAPLSTQGGIQLYIANNPEATGILAIDQAHVDATIRAQRYPKDQYPNEAVRDHLFQRDASNFIRENPSRFAELCLIHLGQFWKLYSPRVPLANSLVMIGSFGIALPFFLIQALRRGWRRGPELLLVIIILSQMALHTVYGSIVRYRIPIEPLILAMAITGFWWSFVSFQLWRGISALHSYGRARNSTI